MYIKTILAGAALALAATIGSASAAEQFSTLAGITAEALTPQEMGAVIGEGLNTIRVTPKGSGGGLANAPAPISGPKHFGSADPGAHATPGGTVVVFTAAA